ncbi:ABC transporter permease subunit [Variovorax ureilyticus]|uniref:ABC transporter permease subunit n=1 Tax=Variovorax ureilyticus TaxID=1836198 RepID=A0ABU8VKX3_9BURK
MRGLRPRDQPKSPMDQIAMPPISTVEPPGPPQFNVRRLTSWLRQVAVVAAALAVLAWLAISIRAGLARNGISFNMGFLFGAANFDIAEGWVVTRDGIREFVASDTNAEALLAGFINTVKTSLVSIALATALGVILGVARISRNWLVRQLSFGLVELVRNTPLLIQLVFWYFAVILKMPALTEASHWFGLFIFSQQGIYIPGLQATGAGSIWSVWCLLLCVLMVIRAASASSARHRLFLAIPAVALLAATFALGFPFKLESPEASGAGVTGGVAMSPEFAALLLALSIYTAAFIAEIVRGAILALPRGQWEAASALGMPRGRVLADVVLPQVYRVVLPAFANQYISLAKTTSLGIAVGFPDLFNVYGTVANQSGRNLEGVIVVMLAYLALSWAISGAVNVLNARLLRKGGAK